MVPQGLSHASCNANVVQGCLYCDPPRLEQPSLLSCGGLTAKQPNGVTSNGNAGSLFNCRELMGMLHIPQLQLTGSPQG